MRSYVPDDPQGHPRPNRLSNRLLCVFYCHWLLLLQERVLFPLLPDRRLRSMARDDDRLVGQGEDAAMQGFQNLLKRSSRQIGPANAAREQRVAGNQQFLRGEIQADAALGMAGGVQNIRGQASGAQALVVVEAGVDLDPPGRGHAEPRCLHVEHLQQRIVVLIKQDGSARLRPQFHRPANMIDVGMGDDDLFHLQLVPPDDREDVFDIVARIDDHRFARGFIADDRTIALQRADGKDFVNHRLYCRAGKVN